MKVVITIKMKDREVDVDFAGDVVTVSDWPLLKRCFRIGYRRQLKKAQREYREREREQSNGDDTRGTEEVRRSDSSGGEVEAVGDSERGLSPIERLREERPSDVGGSEAEKRESKREAESVVGEPRREEESTVSTEQVKALLGAKGHGVREH